MRDVDLISLLQLQVFLIFDYIFRCDPLVLLVHSGFGCHFGTFPRGGNFNVKSKIRINQKSIAQAHPQYRQTMNYDCFYNQFITNLSLWDVTKNFVIFFFCFCKTLIINHFYFPYTPYLYTLIHWLFQLLPLCPVTLSPIPYTLIPFILKSFQAFFNN